jgi:hypothetical protein
MATRMWICDSCRYASSDEPWTCPGCGKETCENCFELFAHCKKCSEGKSDEELARAAVKAGWMFQGL